MCRFLLMLNFNSLGHIRRNVFCLHVQIIVECCIIALDAGCFISGGEIKLGQFKLRPYSLPQHLLSFAHKVPHGIRLQCSTCLKDLHYHVIHLQKRRGVQPLDSNPLTGLHLDPLSQLHLELSCFPQLLLVLRMPLFQLRFHPQMTDHRAYYLLFYHVLHFQKFYQNIVSCRPGFQSPQHHTLDLPQLSHVDPCYLLLAGQDCLVSPLPMIQRVSILCH